MESKGQMPAAASWSYNKEQEEYTFHPNATFTSTLSRALSYCQGACAYATEAVKQAQAAMPTPAPSEVARTSFSSMSRDMRSGAGAPVASVPSACEAWTLGVTVNVGQTMFSLADQQKVALSALQLAAGGRIGEPVTYLIDGAWYHFQPQGKQVSVYYCSRSPVQVSRPEGPRPLDSRSQHGRCRSDLQALARVLASRLRRRHRTLRPHLRSRPLRPAQATQRRRVS